MSVECEGPYHWLDGDDGGAEVKIATYQSCCDIGVEFDLCRSCYDTVLTAMGGCSECGEEFPYLRDILVSTVWL